MSDMNYETKTFILDWYDGPLIYLEVTNGNIYLYHFNGVDDGHWIYTVSKITKEEFREVFVELKKPYISLFKDRKLWEHKEDGLTTFDKVKDGLPDEDYHWDKPIDNYFP